LGINDSFFAPEPLAHLPHRIDNCPAPLNPPDSSTFRV